jgi:hypothetical protein
MFVEFNAIGLSLSGQVYVKEAVYGRTGHPDSWEEDEPAEVMIESLECEDTDAMFLLKSVCCEQIETAAYNAAIKARSGL